MPAGNPIQAQLPNRPTLHDAMMSNVLPREVVWQPPSIIEADGLAISADKDFFTSGVKFMQNCSATAVKYKIGSEIQGADDFHGILAGGSAQDDGLGSVVNLSNIQEAIYVAAVSGSVRVAITRGVYNA